MELGPKNHNGDGLLGPSSIMVVYMDPLGSVYLDPLGKGQGFQLFGPGSPGLKALNPQPKTSAARILNPKTLSV